MLSLLVSLMSFTCQQREECTSSSPTKEKHPPVISENAAGRRRGREGDRQGDRGSEIIWEQNKKGNVEQEGLENEAEGMLYS